MLKHACDPIINQSPNRLYKSHPTAKWLHLGLFWLTVPKIILAFSLQEFATLWMKAKVLSGANYLAIALNFSTNALASQRREKLAPKNWQAPFCQGLNGRHPNSP
jgi:hypothetical protein